MSNRLESKDSSMMLESALALVKAAGYRVSKPRAPRDIAPLGLNAVGKPYSSQYNPNYRMKYKPRRYAPSGNSGASIGPGISAAQWLRMCCEAQTEWNKRNPPCGPHFEQDDAPSSISNAGVAFAD